MSSHVTEAFCRLKTRFSGVSSAMKMKMEKIPSGSSASQKDLWRYHGTSKTCGVMSKFPYGNLTHLKALVVVGKWMKWMGKSKTMQLGIPFWGFSTGFVPLQWHVWQHHIWKIFFWSVWICTIFIVLPPSHVQIWNCKTVCLHLHHTKYQQGIVAICLVWPGGNDTHLAKIVESTSCSFCTWCSFPLNTPRAKTWCFASRSSWWNIGHIFGPHWRCVDSSKRVTFISLLLNSATGMKFTYFFLTIYRTYHTRSSLHFLLGGIQLLKWGP